MDFQVPSSEYLSKFQIAPLSDVYRAGTCPECGEFAVGTWRSPNAPVYCRHGHMWYRESLRFAKGIKK